ncbi:zinc-binding dehydrogenase [Alkalicoccus luteus]|uniref:Zinc-binding dehydrogenase n=1 Tax=Alkalicoccus luteus TaxID=1237094 RepID=A0A969PT02_9BACI|nr:zinc-binding dehydrogenase [Alkalicoccus luteus]NJP38955.1 zinc-binding dehydrogenase [Alkalicoccus luteus]
MKALVLEETGKWEGMKVEELERPVPQEGELLVRVKAAGLNPVDYKMGENGYPGWEFPHVLGLDTAGEVEETGPGTEGFAAGDPVVGLNNMAERGAFAEFTILKAHTAAKLPYNVTYSDAAALPVAGYTAYQALFDKLRVREGESILIHAGAGGVGSFAIQLAKDAGLTVYTTARSVNHDYVKELGADAAVDYSEESFTERILQETGGLGVDHVLDTVGTDNADASIVALSYNGQVAFIAGAPHMDDAVDFQHPKSFHQVALGSVYQSGSIRDEKRIGSIGSSMLSMLSNGRLKIPAIEKVPMVDVPKALQRIKDRHVRGKLIAEW